MARRVGFSKRTHLHRSGVAPTHLRGALPHQIVLAVNEKNTDVPFDSDARDRARANLTGAHGGWQPLVFFDRLSHALEVRFACRGVAE